MEADIFHLLHYRFVHHLITSNGVVLELAFSLSEAIWSNLVVSVYTLQSQCHILGLKLGERSIVCDVIRNIREFYTRLAAPSAGFDSRQLHLVAWVAYIRYPVHHPPVPFL